MASRHGARKGELLNHSKALGFKVLYKANEVEEQLQTVIVIVPMRDDENLKWEIPAKTEWMLEDMGVCAGESTRRN